MREQHSIRKVLRGLIPGHLFPLFSNRAGRRCLVVKRSDNMAKVRNPVLEYREQPWDTLV